MIFFFYIDILYIFLSMDECIHYFSTKAKVRTPALIEKINKKIYIIKLYLNYLIIVYN